MAQGSANQSCWLQLRSVRSLGQTLTPTNTPQDFGQLAVALLPASSGCSLSACECSAAVVWLLTSDYYYRVGVESEVGFGLAFVWLPYFLAFLFSVSLLLV